MLPRASVSRSHPRTPVPSPWFCTTSTVSSARRLRACCIPLPTLGFVTFPAVWRLLAHRRTGCWRRTTHFPRRCFVPFEEFPSPTAVPRHRGRCLPAVSNETIAVLGKRPFPGSPSAHRRIEASAPRLCSVFESVAPAPPFPVALRPVLPWALFPLQGPSAAGIPLPANAVTCAWTPKSLPRSPPAPFCPLVIAAEAAILWAILTC